MFTQFYQNYIFFNIWFDKRFFRCFCSFQLFHELCCHDCFSLALKFDWRQNSFFCFNKLWQQLNVYEENYVNWKNEETDFDFEKNNHCLIWRVICLKIKLKQHKNNSIKWTMNWFNKNFSKISWRKNNWINIQNYVYALW